MRHNIVPVGGGEMTYEIRAIVDIADKLKALGLKTNMENIGDPVAKGEQIPAWMKQIVVDLALDNASYGYCPTRGVLEAREFICELTNRRGRHQITPEDILFFNGLGDAIQKVYGSLHPESRVIVPSPTYSTHSSAEAANAGQPPVTYRLDPDNHWLPDLEELRNKVKFNPAIAGILLINPDNPTGVVYPESALKEIVAIAKEYDLFIVSDEIYHNITYNGESTLPISDLIDDVPAIAMKGISKEFPWPGGRSGWIEVYNADKDPIFAKYVACILNAKLVEVCATTLPQMAISKMMTHPEYPVYLEARKRRYELASNIAYDTLKGVPGLKVNRTNGAFYMAVAFDDGLLNERQTLPIANAEVRELVEKLVAAPGCSLDKRFVYYLLASTGICTVPLTSFCTAQNGFRITLLERDMAELGRIFQKIAASVTAYLNS